MLGQLIGGVDQQLILNVLNYFIREKENNGPLLEINYM